MFLNESWSGEWCKPLRLAAVVAIAAVAGTSAMARELGGHPMSTVAPIDAFRYFSGAVEATGNHPTIYAGRIKGRGDFLVVVGRGYERTFKMKDYEQAFAAYRCLLERVGYHQDDATVCEPRVSQSTEVGRPAGDKRSTLRSRFEDEHIVEVVGIAEAGNAR